MISQPNWELDGKVADSIDHEMKMKCNFFFGMNPMPKCTHLQVWNKNKNQIHMYTQTNWTKPNRTNDKLIKWNKTNSKMQVKSY